MYRPRLAPKCPIPFPALIYKHKFCLCGTLWPMGCEYYFPLKYNLQFPHRLSTYNHNNIFIHNSPAEIEERILPTRKPWIESFYRNPPES